MCDKLTDYNLDEIEFKGVEIEEENKIEDNINKEKNRGTGAGGSNTNYYGKKFEDETNNYFRLLENGYERNILVKNPKKISHYYLLKFFEDKK